MWAFVVTLFNPDLEQIIEHIQGFRLFECRFSKEFIDRAVEPLNFPLRLWRVRLRKFELDPQSIAGVLQPV